MEQYFDFYDGLFKELKASVDYREYNLQEHLQIGTTGHWQRLHRIGGDDVLVSFVKRSQVKPPKPDWTLNQFGHPFRLEWTLDKGGNDVYDKIILSRSSIENEIGAKLDWERKDNKKRCIIALYYKGDDNDDKRIEWVMGYAKPFIDTLTKAKKS